MESLLQFIKQVFSTEWMKLGVALGLNQSQIGMLQLQKQQFADPPHCFLDVLLQQLCNLHQLVDYSYDWTTLMTVLSSQSVEENDMADLIQQIFAGNNEYNFVSL